MLTMTMRLRPAAGTVHTVMAAATQSRFFGGASSDKLMRTPLFSAHNESGGKMVDFCGWELPVQYTGLGIIDSVKHTRQAASAFDVSHMLQIRIHGADREKFMDSLVVSDIIGLEEKMGCLSVMTTDQGTIIDDTIIVRQKDSVNVVLNAGCADKDMVHINKKLAEAKAAGMDVTIEERREHALVALQGPKAAEVLQPMVPHIDLSKMPFMKQEADTQISGIDGCNVTRCGYTGEDGFELAVPAAQANAWFEALLKMENVAPAGLAARDVLRLEAGLCLYGNDIDETVTPVEATLLWTVAKKKRVVGAFPGAQQVIDTIAKGAEKKRVGLLNKGAPARQGSEILNEAGEVVGVVTSGTHSPILGAPVCMGYVPKHLAKAGTKLQVSVRGRASPAEVAKMPFVPSNYFKL